MCLITIENRMLFAEVKLVVTQMSFSYILEELQGTPPPVIY